MQNENTKPETERQPDDLRSALLDINAFAADALYRNDATPEDAVKGYLDALEAIRKIINPGTFFTPSAVVTGALPALPGPQREGFLAKHRMCYVRLPGLYGVRFDGIERQDGTRRVYGAVCRTVEGGIEHFEIFSDNVKVAEGECHIGHSVAAAMVKSMAKTLIRRKEHSIRNRANRKAKRAETVEPIEPADAIPPRPELPEDDE